MKKLLFQLDTDPVPASFDTVIAYDGGAEHVIAHGGIGPDNVRPVVEGAIFTRAGKHKQNTALFVGGSDMQAGARLLACIQEFFFQDFRVSVMLDSNGSNTTAAAAVTKILSSTEVQGKKAVILAGTGPVGQRAALLLARSGAEVSISSRKKRRALHVTRHLQENFAIQVQAEEAVDNQARGELIQDAQIVLGAGRSGVQLIEQEHWQDRDQLQVLADANATPPLGIEGVEMTDRGQQRHGKIAWGALGFGALKISIHKACIARLFTATDHILDAETIFQLARELP